MNGFSREKTVAIWRRNAELKNERKCNYGSNRTQRTAKERHSVIYQGRKDEEADHYSSHYLCFTSDRDAGRFPCYSRK